MHSNNYEWLITQTVEAMLPRFSSDEICLVMKLEMNWQYLSEDCMTRKAFRKDILLAFHRPHNYTKVLYREIDNPFYFHDENCFQMNCLSDHDSCWRSDGMTWIFNAFMEAWDHFEDLGINGREIEPNFHYHIGSSGRPHYRTVLLEPIKNNYGTAYKYNVCFGDEIPMHKISEYMPKD